MDRWVQEAAASILQYSSVAHVQPEGVVVFALAPSGFIPCS